jgi:hypothetical protein
MKSDRRYVHVIVVKYWPITFHDHIPDIAQHSNDSEMNTDHLRHNVFTSVIFEDNFTHFITQVLYTIIDFLGIIYPVF